jgi:hypothetical protein
MWMIWLWAACGSVTSLPTEDSVTDTPQDTTDTPAPTDDTPSTLDTSVTAPPGEDTAPPPPPTDTAPPAPPPPPPGQIPAALDGVNLLVNGDLETGDLTGWTVITTGGDGFAISTSGPHGGTYAVATSYQDSEREQSVDLIAAGFTDAMLDAIPRVHVEAWVRETCATGDRYHLAVALLDAAGNPLEDRAVSGVTSAVAVGCDYADDTWTLLSFDLTAYPVGLRRIVYRDGGQDSEFWAGHYGVYFDDVVVALFNP